MNSITQWMHCRTSSRVETQSPGSPADLESIQVSSGRLVCLPRILTLSGVVFPDRNTDTLAHIWLRGLCKYMPRSLEPPCLSPGWDMVDLSGLSLVVIDTVTQARAPSTRHLYAFKWCLFAEGRPIGDAQSDQCFLSAEQVREVAVPPP